MKTSDKKTSALISVIILYFFFTGITMAGQNQSDQRPDVSEIRSEVSLWDYYFREHVKKGDDAGKVKKAIMPKSLDWGIIDYGGTGTYALRFKLDDFMQAEFQFSKSDKLQSYRVFWKRELWMKDPHGYIVYQRAK